MCPRVLRCKVTVRAVYNCLLKCFVLMFGDSTVDMFNGVFAILGVHLLVVLQTHELVHRRFIIDLQELFFAVNVLTGWPTRSDIGCKQVVMRIYAHDF
jgi:hypothetical protein